MGNKSAQGEKAYTIKLRDKYKLGEGAYGTVYRIKTKDKKTKCAAKIFKVPLKMMNQLEQLGYDREL